MQCWQPSRQSSVCPHNSLQVTNSCSPCFNAGKLPAGSGWGSFARNQAHTIKATVAAEAVLSWCNQKAQLCTTLAVRCKHCYTALSAPCQSLKQPCSQCTLDRRTCESCTSTQRRNNRQRRHSPGPVAASGRQNASAADTESLPHIMGQIMGAVCSSCRSQLPGAQAQAAALKVQNLLYHPAGVFVNRRLLRFCIQHSTVQNVLLHPAGAFVPDHPPNHLCIQHAPQVFRTSHCHCGTGMR